MPISKDHLVDVLRVRYDAYSAEAVFIQACARAGLDGTTSFDQRALMSFREGLNQVGDRVGGVLARIDALLGDGSAGAPETKADAKGDKSEGKKAKAEEPKAEAKPEAKTEKSEAKADAKADAKTEAGKTTIVLRGLDVEDGEMVLVCGDHPALGDWEPDDAAMMTPEGKAWSVTLDLPADAEVAFKFLVRDEDGEARWEAGGNRTVRGSQKLDATWRESS